MSTRNSPWRRLAVVGMVALAGAAYPLSAAAQQQQQPQISGAAVEVGGVQRSGGGAAPAPRVASVPARAPVILPNTGTGPMDDATTPELVLICAGLLALGAGACVYRRRSKNTAEG